MASYSTSTPLRVIAHVDLDAFYAQCEQVRLGLPPDTPLAVQQWGGLIAINYPARACGLTRFITLADARRLCPELVVQHVATWKEGEAKWAYRDDAALNMGTQKVSLDPYRAQSRRILACIKDTLAPGKLQRVEKASVDEVFIDLSAQVHAELLKRYPEQLAGPPPYDDPSERLPRPPTTALDWQTDALVDLDASQTEEDDPDWDDLVILISSEIVRDVRAAVRAAVNYTCSAGIARNKMLAKLGSGANKPNRQTVIRNRAVAHFLQDLKFTKIRNLGGKLGDEVVSAFGTDEVRELLRVPLEQLRGKLGDDTGTWLYQIVRGEDASEVSARTQIKSMLSAKSFRPTISSLEVAARWLRIFVADIFSRLVDDGLLEKRRRPRTLNLHHRQVGQMRSRQAPLPTGRALDEGVLYDIARQLLAQVVADGRAWPCSNLSLSVGGFEEVAVAGNRGIGGFLVRGEEAAALKRGDSTGGGVGPREGEDEGENNHLHPDKRRRLGGLRSGGGAGIARFFATTREDSKGDGDDVGSVAGAESDGSGLGLRHQDSYDSLGSERKGKRQSCGSRPASAMSVTRNVDGLGIEREPPHHDIIDKIMDNNDDDDDDNDDNVVADPALDNINYDNLLNGSAQDDPWSTPPSAQPPPRHETTSHPYSRSRSRSRASSTSPSSPPPPDPAAEVVASASKHHKYSSDPNTNPTRKSTTKPSSKSKLKSRSNTNRNRKPKPTAFTSNANPLAPVSNNNNNNNNYNTNTNTNTNANNPPPSKNTENSYTCPRCATSLPTLYPTARLEHEDWHLARDLQAEEEEREREREREHYRKENSPRNNTTNSNNNNNAGTAAGSDTTAAATTAAAAAAGTTRESSRTPAGNNSGKTGHGVAQTQTQAQVKKRRGRGRPPKAESMAAGTAATARGQMRLAFGR